MGPTTAKEREVQKSSTSTSNSTRVLESKSNHVENEELLQVLRNSQFKSYEFESNLKILRQHYELNLTDVLSANTNPWDSIFTCIFQNIFVQFQSLDMDEIYPYAGSTALKLEVKLNEIKRKGKTFQITSQDLINAFKIQSNSDPDQNPNDLATPLKKSSQLLTNLLDFTRQNLEIQLNLFLYNFFENSLDQLETPATSNPHHHTDEIDINTIDIDLRTKKTMNVVLLFDPELSIFRSIVFRHQLSPSLDDYCEEILEHFVEEQEMIPYLEKNLSKLHPNQFQEYVQNQLTSLENPTAPISTFHQFHTVMLPDYTKIVEYSNLLLLEKYEKNPAISSIKMEDLLRRMKIQYAHAMETAASFVLQSQISAHHDKVVQLLEREDELVVVNEKLDMEMNQHELDKKAKEQELQKLEMEGMKFQGDKEKYHKILEEKRAALEKTKELIAITKGNLAWNEFKSQLAQVHITYENLKKNSFISWVQSSRNSLFHFLQTISLIFPLHSFDPANRLWEFAKRIENDTEENKKSILSILDLLFEPPKIALKIGRSDCVQVTGRQIVLSQILPALDQYKKIRELVIVAADVIYLDESLSKEKFHGRNLVISAPKVVVTKEMEINTCGYDGEPIVKEGKANDGERAGRAGTDGRDGTAGENAGHIQILAIKLEGAEKLKLCANGGAGGHGQDGGNGCDGDDGYDGKDGFVQDESYWLSLVTYKIDRGTSGRVGQKGGDGGAAGLGGQGGDCGEIKVTPKSTLERMTIKNTRGDQGHDGDPGKGAYGGKGGKDGVDHGIAWHNYAFTSGEFRKARGKLDVRKQDVWYGGNGWDLIIVKTEAEVKTGRACNGETGSRGTTANRRSHQRQSYSKNHMESTDSEIAVLSHTIQSEYKLCNSTAEMSMKNSVTALESQEKSLSAQSEQAKKSKETAESNAAATAERTEKVEKAKLEIVKAMEETQRERKKMAEEQEEIFSKKSALSSPQEMKEVEMAKKALKGIQNVVKTHLEVTAMRREIQQSESHQNSRSNVTAELDPSKITGNGNTTGHEFLSAASPDDEKEPTKIELLYDEVRTVKNIGKLSDEFFVIAIASRIQSEELANAFEIGLEAAKASTEAGNKLPDFIRTFLLEQSEKLSQISTTDSPADLDSQLNQNQKKTPADSVKFITPLYLREKFPLDMSVVTATQPWADQLENQKTLKKIFKLNTAAGDGTPAFEEDSSSVGNFILHFRRIPFTPKKIEHLRRAIKKLGKKLEKEQKEGKNKAGTSQSQRHPGQIILDHLTTILIDHMESWFLIQCASGPGGCKFSPEALEKIPVLLRIVNKIYEDLTEIPLELSLHETYTIFLQHIQTEDILKKSEVLMWQDFALELTGLLPSKKREKTKRKLTTVECILLEMDKIEKELLQLRLLQYQSKTFRKCQQKEIEEEEEKILDKLRMALATLCYLLPYLQLSPENLGALMNRCEALSVCVWQPHQRLFLQIQTLATEIERNYIENFQKEKTQSIFKHIKEADFGMDLNVRAELNVKVSGIIRRLDSPWSSVSFVDRLSAYSEILNLFGVKVKVNAKGQGVEDLKACLSKVEEKMAAAGVRTRGTSDHLETPHEIHKLFQNALENLIEISSLKNPKVKAKEKLKNVADFVKLLKAFQAIILKLSESRYQHQHPRPYHPDDVQNVQELTKGYLALNSSIQSFFTRFVATGKLELNCALDAALTRLQLNLESPWQRLLATKFSQVLWSRKTHLKKGDVIMEEILQFIKKILESSHEILFPKEILQYTKTHLLKLSRGLQIQFKSPQESFEKILSKLLEKSKMKSPKKFIKTMCKIINEEARTELDFKLEEKFDSKLKILLTDVDGKIQETVKKFDKTGDWNDLLILIKNSVGKITKTHLESNRDKTPVKSSQDQQQFSSLGKFLQRLQFLALYSTKMDHNIFDHASNVKENENKKELEEIQQILSKLNCQEKFQEKFKETEKDPNSDAELDSPQAKKPEPELDSLETLSIKNSLCNLSKLLKAEDEGDFNFLYQFLHDLSQIQETSLKDSLTSLFESSRNYLQDLFQIYTENPENVLTFATPLNYFMEQLSQRILPTLHVHTSDDSLSSSSLATTHEILDKIYVDSVIKYLSRDAIPSMPSELRASVLQMNQQKTQQQQPSNESTLRASDKNLSKIFTVFQHLLGKDLNQNWILPFITVYTQLIDSLPHDTATCSELGELTHAVNSFRISSLNLVDASASKKKFNWHLENISRGLTRLSREILQGKLDQIPSQVYLREFLYKWEQIARLVTHSDPNQHQLGIIHSEIYMEIETFLNGNPAKPNKGKIPEEVGKSEKDKDKEGISVPPLLDQKILHLFHKRLVTILPSLTLEKTQEHRSTREILQFLLHKSNQEFPVHIKWTTILAILILHLKLSIEEKEFFQRIFGFEQKSSISWNPSEKQIEMIQNFIRIRFPSQSEKSASESQSESTEEKKQPMNLIQIMTEEICLENKNISISYLYPTEQFYLTNITALSTVHEQPEIVQCVKNMLTNSSPSEWLFNLREMTLNTHFRRLLHLYIDPDFEGRLEGSGQVTDTALVGSLKEQFKIYRNTHYESNVNYEALKTLAEKYDRLYPSPTLDLLLKTTVHRLIDLKHFFNRHFFFARQSQSQLEQEKGKFRNVNQVNVDQERLLILWLEIIHTRCSVRKLPLPEFNDLLYRSVQIPYSQLIQIGQEATFDTWFPAILTRILLQNYQQLVRKCQGKQLDVRKNESAQKMEEQLKKMTKDCKNPLWTKILALLSDKLKEEILFASTSTSMDLQEIHTVFTTLHAHQRENLAGFCTLKLYKELKRQPLGRWTNKFREQKLLQTFDSKTTNAILKMEEKFGKDLALKFLEIVSPSFQFELNRETEPEMKREKKQEEEEENENDMEKHSDSEKPQESFNLTLNSFLDKFNQNHWPLDEILLNLLKETCQGGNDQKSSNGPPHTKTKNVTHLKQLETVCTIYTQEVKGRKRDASELTRLMRQDPKNSTILPNLLRIQKDVNKCSLEIQLDAVLNALKSPSALYQKSKGKKKNKCEEEENEEDDEEETPICLWDQPDIAVWTKIVTQGKKEERRERVITHTPEVLAVLSRALETVKGFGTRVTQLLSILILLDRAQAQKSCLAEIATGEGKTFIVATLVVYRALCGDDVDVVTSSSVLAEENESQVSAFLRVFSITVSNNCDSACEKDEKTRKERYKSQVIYGDVGSFQRDILLTEFFHKGITMGRTAGMIFVDEVDSMLLDKGENVLYLSHSIPDLKYLWPLFIEIWQAVHAPDVSLARNSDIYLIVRFIRERIRQGELYFPNVLTKFIQSRLPIWVKNAFLAKNLQENDPYILADVDKKGPKIVIVDKDTGVEQISMNWSNGLHQFLQCKHTDRLTSESLKAVFTSNISYLREFQGRLFGITGTLGSDSERELLMKCYQVQVCAIPRFKSRWCYEEEGFTFTLGNRLEWLEKIQENVKIMCKVHRAVLVICENVENVDLVSGLLKTEFGSDVYAYKSSWDEEFKRRRAAGPLTGGSVIVATNIAGRGTDLKTSAELEEAGGLHVILSYMPTNVRIEEQAFGRTARAGQSGSVQYIVMDKNSGTQHGNLHGDQEEAMTTATTMTIEEMRRKRNEVESQRLDNFRIKSIPRIELEEKLCGQFKFLLESFHHHFNPPQEKILGILPLPNIEIPHQFQKFIISGLPSLASLVPSQLKEMNEFFEFQYEPRLPQEVIQLQLENLKNRWAMWLDSMSERIALVHITGEMPILDAFQVFRTDILKTLTMSKTYMKKNGTSTSMTLFERGPTEIIKLGRYYEDKAKDLKMAEEYFDSAISLESNYSEIAHYYKASIILQKDSSNSASNSDSVNSKKLAISHLKKADALIRRRMNLLMSSSQTLDLTSKMQRETLSSGTLSNRYETQVINECELLQVHLGKIGEAIGTTVNERLMGSIKGVLEEREGAEIFQTLRRHHSILKNYRLSQKVRMEGEELTVPSLPGAENSVVKWPSTFGYCKTEVLEFLEKKSKSRDRTLEESSFESFVLNQGKFWGILNLSGFLEQGSQVLVSMEMIKAEKVEKLETNELEEKSSSSSIFDSIEDFPEHLQDLKSPLERILLAHNQEEWSSKFLEDFELQPPIQYQLEEFLRKSGFLVRSSTHEAIINSQIKSSLKWNKFHRKWDGFPQRLEKYRDLLEVFMEETPDPDIPETLTEPSLKSKLIEREIPLPETTTMASSTLWNFLLNSGAIKNCRVKFPISSARTQKDIDDRLGEIRKALESESISREMDTILEKFHSHSSDQDQEKAAKIKLKIDLIENLMHSLKSAIGRVKTFPKLKMSYEQLQNYYKTGEYPPEIEDFKDLMFAHVLEVAEVKSWWNWGTFIVAMMGVAQVAAGIYLTTCTSGLMAHMGVALISEGLSDVAFAIQAGISGNFSWKDYGVHKAVSLVISITCAGIGAYLSMGTKIAESTGKFGFALLRTVGLQVLKECTKTLVFTVADMAMDKLLVKIQEEIVTSVGESLSEKLCAHEGTQEKFAELDQAINQLHRESFEAGQAEKIINESFESVLTSVKAGSTGVMIQKHGTTVASTLVGQMSQSASKIMDFGNEMLEKKEIKSSHGAYGKAAKVMKFIKWIRIIIKTAEIGKMLHEMIRYIPEVIGKLIAKLKTAGANLRKNREQKDKKTSSSRKSSSEDFTKFKSTFTGSMKKDILDWMLTQVKSTLVSPALQTLSHFLMKKIGRAIASGTKSLLFNSHHRDNIARLSDYRPAMGKEKKAIAKGRKINIEELSPDQNLANYPNETVGDAINLYGNSCNFYQDASGQILFEKMPFEQAVQNMGKGSTAGLWELTMCANCDKQEFCIKDLTGELKGEDPDGMIRIKPSRGILGAFKTQKPPVDLAYVKTADGNYHFMPMVNGVPLEIPQGPGQTNTCLFQSIAFHNEMRTRGGSSPGQMDTILNELANEECLRRHIQRYQHYTKKSSTARFFYENGMSEASRNFQGGARQGRRRAQNQDFNIDPLEPPRDFMINSRGERRRFFTEIDLGEDCLKGDLDYSVPIVSDEARAENPCPLDGTPLMYTIEGSGGRLEYSESVYHPENTRRGTRTTDAQRNRIWEMGNPMPADPDAPRPPNVPYDVGHAHEYKGGGPGDVDHNTFPQNPTLNRGEDSVYATRTRNWVRNHPDRIAHVRRGFIYQNDWDTVPYEYQIRTTFAVRNRHAGRYEVVRDELFTVQNPPPDPNFGQRRQQR